MVTRRLCRWGWLVRYWCMDKYARQVSAGALVLACMVSALLIATLAVRSSQATEQRADGGFSLVWYIVILLVSSYISYRMRAKNKPPDPQLGQAPEVKDGRALREVFGTCWISDPTIVSWSNGSPEPIKKKGGKK